MPLPRETAKGAEALHWLRALLNVSPTANTQREITLPVTTILLSCGGG